MALLLIRTSARAAESLGVRRSWARLSCMALSAAIAAIGGALLSFSSSTVSPNSFTFWTSIFLLVGSVVSLHSLSLVGGLIGGVFLTLVPLLLAGAGDWVPILYGAALLGGGARRQCAAGGAARPARREGDDRMSTPSPMAPSLVVQDIWRLSFGGIQVLQRHRAALKPGRDHRPDRPERRRQDQLLQLPDRALRAAAGQHARWATRP